MIQWYPGHMAQTKRNMDADMALIDMIIEVIDARIPRASRNPDLEIYTKKKCHLLLLNKVDLADAGETQTWVQYYRRLGYIPVAINAARKQGLKEMQAAISSASQPMLEKLRSRGRLPRAVRAMVVGIPNCGKSTVINALAPSASAKTGNKPGVTKGRQWVKTNAGIELLDTPGMLWPKFASEDVAFKLAVCGSISDAVFPVYEVACELAKRLANLVPQVLLDRYKLKELPPFPEEILIEIAKNRGMLGAGGKIREDDAAMVLLQEFRSGKLGRISLESPRSPEAEAEGEKK
ncbi:MAG: ribosome biogenesis GTPase YlqF [Bacillota bacterium]|nr:ribosome biogenesis GTPase YlqF [Bacillota bacterium]